MRAFLPVQLALCGGLLITGCNPNQTPSVDSNNASLLDTYAAPDSSDISSVVPPATETLSNATQSDTDIFDATQSASDISDATQPAPDISDATQSASDISDATQPASSSFDIAQFSSDLADATQPSNDINDGTQFAKDLSDGEQEGEEVYLPKDVVEGDVAIFGEPVANVDVLVIGAGPAGLSAAWEARLAGASVVILEMGEKAGGGGSYAYTFFAAGSPWQEQEGYPNSFEETVAAWPSITGGGDATDPLVSKFLLHSSETLLWLVNDVGAEVAGVVPCIGECATPTSHMVMSKGKGAVGLLVDSLSAETWLQHRADTLVLQDGAVVGAQFTNLSTGAVGWVEAKATVVATGGFARNVERILKDRPELGGTLLAYDNHPLAIGGGHPLLEQVEAQYQNQGNHNVYIHSIADYRPGFEDEVLWVLDLFDSVIVDSNGKRVINEYEIMGFDAVEKLVSAPGKRLWAIVPEKTFQKMLVIVPPYNCVEDNTFEALSPQDLLLDGAACGYEDLESLATDLGFDGEGLASTIELYDSFVAKEQDDDFGKPMSDLSAFNGGPYFVVELAAGTAKAFTGFALSEKSEILGPDGDAFPGLYGAGEVAGMLGSPAVAKGFEGSIAACYYTGRVAGQNAAAEALAAGGD